MDGLLCKNYAEKVTSVDLSLLHHPVFHPEKLDKVRGMFDYLAEYRNSCLKKKLLQGPDPTNLLVGVLKWFGQEPVAFMLDIEAMLYQVLSSAKRL